MSKTKQNRQTVVWRIYIFRGGMHTMARRNPRFVGTDVIRLFETNLSLADKRLVVAWFFSLIPIKEPKVDALQLLLDFFSLIPIAGRAADLFQISLATAQAAKDVAEIFGFEFEEEEVELSKLRQELQDITQEFRKQREELRLLRLELDEAREQSNALRATIELLEDEIRDLISRPPTGNFDAELDRILVSADNIDVLVSPSLGPSGWPFIENALDNIRGRVSEIREKTRA